jgi:hypothetical protein
MFTDGQKQENALFVSGGARQLLNLNYHKIRILNPLLVSGFSIHIQKIKNATKHLEI